MSREELLKLLDDMRERVASRDSFEGHIQYLIADVTNEHPFDVAAMYRVGNSMGQGGCVLVGAETREEPF
ncbi:hypothetical protein OG211_12145 [Streptomyces niveus]|uniref:hypothetical protein n=1 Tax=Streptomyces TaxID=1883 RepID=UPI002E34B7F9|nr:hypothetical protein [Streptomyces sp. NBC_01716]WTA59174.1 hypothetical protein OG211_12145 [Streptomyces niveus]